MQTSLRTHGVFESMTSDPDDEGLNASLDEMIVLLEREVARLKAALEVYRLLEGNDAARIARQHVASLEEREGRLADLRDLRDATAEPRQPDD